MGVGENVCSGCFGDFFVWVCRFWGLATAVGCWGIGVEASYYGHYLGFYLLAVAVLLTFLESVFAINYCVELCISSDKSCWSCWRIVLWLDDWKKGAFYILLSIACFIKPHEVWMSIISGVMLIVCGFFNILKTFKTRIDRERIRVAEKPSYDKFDEIHDDIVDDDDDDDDNVINHHGTITIMADVTVGDQQEILEV